MIRTTLAAAALLLAAPVHAQSFYPNLYGARFCQLRAMGLSAADARRTAMSEAYSQFRQPTYVTVNGNRITLDAIDAANFVASTCPQYLQ